MRAYPETNWAVACGRDSGVFVVDIDPRHDGFQSIADYQDTAGQLPNTLTALTGGGGRHLFFAYPAESTVGNRTSWIQGVDVKSDGGYVILAPSNHASGAHYSWQNWDSPDDEPMIAPAPDSLVLSITQKGATGDSDFELPDDESFLQGIDEGLRNDTIFRWACSFRRRNGDSSKNIAWMVIQRAAAACTPPYPEDEARTCLESAWSQDHSDPGRPDILLGTGGENESLTDRGNARRLIALRGNDIRFVPAWGWMYWDDGRWVRDEVNRVKSWAREEVPALIEREAAAMEGDRLGQRRHRKHGLLAQNQGPQNAMLASAENDSRIISHPDDFDSDDMIIACRNGVVDLRTGELREATRDDLVSQNTDITYDPGADQTRWLDFLAETLNGDEDVIEYVQRAAGYSLTGSNREEIFFIISGPPASGKSSFLDGLGTAMGTYSTVAQADTFMYRRNQSSTDNAVAHLAGRRLVTMSEIREGESFSEAAIKQFTGGDKVTGKFLYREPFQFRPQAKLWIGTNHDPIAKDDAMWRRIRKIPFPKTVPEEDRDKSLKDYLCNKEEGAMAVLVWAVQGAMKWNQKGLVEPLKISQETAAYRQIQDRDTAFINDVLNINVTGEVSTLNDVYAAYRLWCDKFGERPKQISVFRNMLTRKDINVEHGNTVIVHNVTLKTAYAPIDWSP